MCPARHGAFADHADVCPDCGERLVIDRRGEEPIAGLRVERLVGRGGSRTTIWEAIADDGMRFAVKLTEPDAEPAEIQRLHATAALVLGVHHPNLAAVHASGDTSDGDAFVVMDLVRGRSLLALLEQRRSLPIAIALHVARAVLAGLGALHAHGIVHRDVKPSNIQLASAGAGAAWEVKILDVGIARRFHADDVPTPLALEGAQPGRFGPLVGTPEYMAPEQVLGHACDPRADLYAVGVVLYRMVSGTLPYVANDRVGYYASHLTATPGPLVLPDGFPAPAGLDRVIATALAKQPSERHPTARDMLLSLSHYG